MFKRRLAASLPVLLSLVTAPLALPQQQSRGVQAVSDQAQVHHGHHYIVAIGIDHYQNWPVLSTAVSDAAGFARLLTTQFGFEYASAPLTEKNATRDAINSLVDDDLRQRLQPEDDLIIFFAGHGTTRDDKFGSQLRSVGFIVPFEARAPSGEEHWSDYINIDDFLRTVGSLPASHILVILDSCHSGMALGSRFTSSRADVRFQEDMLSHISRKVIASAEGNQLAADQGPLPDDSLFTGLLIQGLTTGKADNFHEGFITASQLGAYVQHEVGVAQGSRQTPLFGAFDPDDGGELIIPLGSGSSAAATSVAASPSGTPVATRSDAAIAPAGLLTALEASEVSRLRTDDRHYWQDDDPLKNFPAARSATLKLCNRGDNWACAQASTSFHTGLGGEFNNARALDLAKPGCQEHFAGACDALGLAHEADQPTESARLYNDVCSQGDLYGCALLSRLYYYRLGVSDDPAKGKLLSSKACDGGELLGCYVLGAMYETGKGVDRDPAKAVELYMKGCDGGELGACLNLGETYIDGTAPSQDSQNALRLFRRVCDSGNPMGCTDLGEMYINAVGVTKDSAAALPLFRKACDGGAMRGCSDLGGLYYQGLEVPRDSSQAERLFRKACDSGEPLGCSNLASLYYTGDGVPKDPNQSVALTRKACDGGFVQACMTLSGFYYKGDGVAKDPAQAAEFSRKACDGGIMEGCANLGYFFDRAEGVPKDYNQALDLDRKACDAGEAAGCDNLGGLYEEGHGVPRDYHQAATFYSQGCNSVDSDKEAWAGACADLGSLYEKGHGVAKDKSQAAALYKKACDAGDDDACKSLHSVQP